MNEQFLQALLQQGLLQQQPAQALVSFKAGRMYKEGGTVVPDRRKGTFSMRMTPEGLLCVEWRDRASNNEEFTLFVTPDFRWRRIDKCSTGRVYLLESRDAGAEHFFWMQEPSDEHDAEWSDKINQYIAEPPQAGGAGGFGDAGAFAQFGLGGFGGAGQGAPQ